MSKAKPEKGTIEFEIDKPLIEPRHIIEELVAYDERDFLTGEITGITTLPDRYEMMNKINEIIREVNKIR